MKTVKTLKKHTNGHGDQFVKPKGSVYKHPNPDADVAAGFIKVVENADSKDGGSKGDGGSSVSTKNGNSKKPN